MALVARVTSAAEGLPRRRFTVAEVEAMVAAGVIDEDERVELIGGDLVPMSPKGNDHELVKTALADRWYRLPECDVDLAIVTTFRLSEDTYLEPDAVIFPEASGIGGSAPRMSCSSSRSPTRRSATTSAAKRRFTRASVFASSGSLTRFD
jgi:hypothetical protein